LSDNIGGAYRSRMEPREIRSESDPFLLLIRLYLNFL
jgi:hypothetical protein